MNAVSFLIIWLLLCVLNGLMDAIDHGKGAMRLNYLWHGTKTIIIIILLMISSSFIPFPQKILFLTIVIIIGHLVFEETYKLFRKIDWRKHLWS